MSLCACQRTVSENEAKEEITFLDKYNEIFLKENAKRAAMIYLDEDSIPELLLLKDGEYQLYSFDGLEVKAIEMPNTEIKMKAYGPIHIEENHDRKQRFYWFEYVPYNGLIRVHDGTFQEVDSIMGFDQERHDYYLKYADGSLTKEFEAKSTGYIGWHTYDAEQEIENEEFLNQLSDLGYDQLIPCGYLYESIADAYENIGAKSDTKKVLEDFVSGEIDALDYVEEIDDISEESFVMKRYEDYYNDVIVDEEVGWVDVIYIDFDNDKEDELIMHGYTGECCFFDVIGDTVYKLLRTSGTADCGGIAEIEGKRVIERTDLLHGGRKVYEIMEYDSCCCLIDYFTLSAVYEGEDHYSVEDNFWYRKRKILMEEFEVIRDSIIRIDLTDIRDSNGE